MAESSYLKKKRDRYYYQRRVPKDVRDHDLFLKLPEVIERSLHTSDPAEARLRAAEENLSFERQLADARGLPQPPLNSASITATSQKQDRQPLPISPDWIEWVASEHYFLLTAPISSAYEYAGFEHEDSEERLQDAESFELASLMAKEDDLKKRKVRVVRRAALSYLQSEQRLASPLERDILKRIKPHPVEQKQEYRDLCQALMDAELDAIQFVRKLYSEGKAPKELDQHHLNITKKPAASKLITLSELAKRYLATSPDVTEEWQRRVYRIVDVCASLGMPTDVSKIRKSHVRDVIDQLQRAPRNWSQKYPGKTIAEAIELGTKESAATLSANTIRDGYIAALKTVFSFAEERELIESNPAQNLKIEKARNDGRGTGFDPNELSKLFRLPLFCGCQDDIRPLIPGDHLIRDHRFWAPLIALFTGARTTEIAQLKLDEVVFDDGLPHFIIQASEEGSLKTHAATRRIPMHVKLIEFGLKSYATELKNGGEQRLFPLWQKPTGKGYPDASSQRFFRRSIIPLITTRTKPRPNFHSFRNTMKDEMVRVGMPPAHQDVILGHEPAGMTRIYHKSRNLADLTESLSRVEFPHVDFSGVIARG
tara:strand:- start:9287 stop:11077 length:1791 start_codon:yes stop_codon:yes gene_type:complete